MGRGERYTLMTLTGKDSMVRCWVLRDCFGGSLQVLCPHPLHTPQIYPGFKFKNFTRSCSILFRIRVVPSTSPRPRIFMTMMLCRHQHVILSFQRHYPSDGCLRGISVDDHR